jgi:hypothetical protein
MADTQYVVMASIPYENDTEAFHGTRDEVKAWLKSSDRGYPLDDLEMYSLDTPDIYQLYNED